MEVKPGYKQTEVGVIPEEWDADNLGRFWGVTDCKHVTAQFVPQGFPLASIREVQSRFVELTNAKQTTAHFYNLLIEGGRKPRPGDLILSRNATVGEVAQVAEWHPPFAMGQDVCLLRKKSNEHSTEFLQSIFQSPVILKQLADLMVGSTFKRANVQQIRNFAVPMPPPPEQRAIAEALSDVDGLLGGLDRLIAKKRDLKQAAMQQLLTGQTRLPGFHGEWRNTTLGQIISRFSTGLNPRQNFRLNSGGNFFYVTIKNFAVGQLFLDANCDLIDESAFWRINERSDLRKDDVLFSSIGRVGDAYLITETPRNWNINESVFTLRPDKSQVVPLMLFYLLTDKTVTDALSQGVTGSTFKSIKQAQLKAIPCQLPASLEEQTAVAEVLTEMDTELAALTQRREKTRALKQAMMQELLTGKTRLI